MSFCSRFINLLIISLPSVAFSSSIPGINNFHKVDQQVYRGAQPTDEGFRFLVKLGIRVILDLREHDQRSLAEERVVSGAGMRYVNVPMTGLTPPSEAQTKMILTLLEDSASGPIFVHCKHGADRTGAVIAAYRIDHDRWDNARSLREALENGMSWFQFPRRNYILTFQDRHRGSRDVSTAGNPLHPVAAGPSVLAPASITAGAND